MKIKTKRSVSLHANIYGNIDVREPLPRGYCHLPAIEGVRLTYWLEKLNIDYVPAMIGFTGSATRGFRPVYDGVVIASRARRKIIDYLRLKGKYERRYYALYCAGDDNFYLFHTFDDRSKWCKSKAEGITDVKLIDINIEPEKIHQYVAELAKKENKQFKNILSIQKSKRHHVTGGWSVSKT